MATLDDSLAQIDALAAKLNAPTEKDMTKAEFEAYVEDQIAKATAEATSGKADVAKERLTALHKQIKTAKASYESSGTATMKVTLYTDPWITLPTTKDAQVTDVPRTETSNVQITGDLPMSAPTEKNAILAKSEKGIAPTAMLKTIVQLAKAGEKSPGRAKLAKTEEGRALVQKAGEATAILSKIAAMFGIAEESPDDLLDWDFRCDVGDMISALQQAARLEGVMTQLGGTLSMMKGDAPAAAPPPAAPPPAAAPPAELTTPTAKSASESIIFGDEPGRDPLNDGQWPLDLNGGPAIVAKDAFAVTKTA